MRVFEEYYFNIRDKVEVKDVVAFLENMLNGLGLKYESLMFDIFFHRDGLEKALTEYPELSKYCYHNLQNRDERIGSLRYDWENGNVYAEDDDKVAVFEIFNKVPRGYNISGGFRLCGIDWFGTGSNGCAFQAHYDMPDILPLVYDNSIHVSYNSAMYLTVAIEVTSEGELKSTKDILDRLKPYLGKATGGRKYCVFDKKEKIQNDEKKSEFYKKFLTRFYDKFPYDQERFVNGLDKPFIINLADKRKLNKAFKGSNFEFTERKKGQGTFNELMCYGPHNYKFEVGIDRTHGMPRSFKAYLRIYGYNFSISNEFEMRADSCEEAQEILNELAKFCMELQDDFFEELASAFGDTPKWFWEKD